MTKATYKIPSGPILKRTIGGWAGIIEINGVDRPCVFRNTRKNHYRWNCIEQGGRKLAHGVSLSMCVWAALGFEVPPMQAARLGLWTPASVGADSIGE